MMEILENLSGFLRAAFAFVMIRHYVRQPSTIINNQQMFFYPYKDIFE